MSLIKDGQGSVLDHALGNAVGILPSIWRSIGEDDRWSVGQTYADVVSTGKARSMSGLREVLLLVAGFDYVPENLRSNTFRQAARAVLDAHFGFNNFFNEEPPVRHLGQLGSVIPQPAFIPCVQALLAVALGNSYGASYSASPEAIRQLSAVGAERLLYYYDRVLDQDDVLLNKAFGLKTCGSVLHNYAATFVERERKQQSLHRGINDRCRQRSKCGSSSTCEATVKPDATSKLETLIQDFG